MELPLQGEFTAFVSSTQMNDMNFLFYPIISVTTVKIRVCLN